MLQLSLREAINDFFAGFSFLSQNITEDEQRQLAHWMPDESWPSSYIFLILVTYTVTIVCASLLDQLLFSSFSPPWPTRCPCRPACSFRRW